MGKYFFKAENHTGSRIVIDDRTAHHMINVLRFRVGQEVLLCDGAGNDYLAILESINKPCTLIFEVINITPSIPEPFIDITLYQGIPKGEKMDWIIEKCIEVGASKIVPVCTSRSVVKIKDAGKKAERYSRIAKAAASQSMRGIVPEVTGPLIFDEALAQCNNNDLHLVAYEKENITIKSSVNKMQPRSVSLWVGPEGGFEEKEVADIINKKSALSISLGARILRTETAGIVAISQILCIWDGVK